MSGPPRLPRLYHDPHEGDRPELALGAMMFSVYGIVVGIAIGWLLWG